MGGTGKERVEEYKREIKHMEEILVKKLEIEYNDKDSDNTSDHVRYGNNCNEQKTKKVLEKFKTKINKNDTYPPYNEGVILMKTNAEVKETLDQANVDK